MDLNKRRRQLIQKQVEQQEYFDNCITFVSSRPFELYFLQKYWYGNLYYSVNGFEWNLWQDETVVVMAKKFGNSFYAYLKGSVEYFSKQDQYSTISILGDEVSCYGDMSDLCRNSDGTTYAYDDYCFACFFKDCVSLVHAPSLSCDTVGKYGYYAMFAGCTKLQSAPQLPATYVNEGSYKHMFTGCTALNTVQETFPEIVDTNSPYYCYQYMFKDCISLQQAPNLPTKRIYKGFYSGMFYGCTSLKKAPQQIGSHNNNHLYNEYTATMDTQYTVEQSGCSDMFRDCTALITPPKLPSRKLGASCYVEMFRGCTSLKIMPTFGQNLPCDVIGTTDSSNAYGSSCYLMYLDTGISSLIATKSATGYTRIYLPAESTTSTKTSGATGMFSWSPLVPSSEGTTAYYLPDENILLSYHT